MISYLEHFSTFIEKNLPTYNDTFRVEDMIGWVQSREPERKPQNIKDHLLKRTTNYESRDNFVPPSSSADDLFFRIGPNLFRRYQPRIDPGPFHSLRQDASGHETKTASSIKRLNVTADVAVRFRTAVTELDQALAGRSLEDDVVLSSVRAWLDGPDKPLPWTLREGLTDDEWFFITTLYGTMTSDGQRTHIRKFFPKLFVAAAKRDIRNFVPDMPEFSGLRSPWMAKRLWRMGEILRERQITMTDYVDTLRSMQEAASAYNPTPALDAIAIDHGATARKTLSVFIRDCVQCNCFPIDSRVSKQLAKYNLPEDERLLVGLSLEIGRNPRQVARMFYEVG